MHEPTGPRPTPNASAQPLRILSLATTFPTPAEPGHGLFVEARLRHVAEQGHAVHVIAPVPWIDYGHPEGRFFSAWKRVPRHRNAGALAVSHPRWWYPPLGGVANAAFLAARVLPVARRLRRVFHFDILDAHFGHPEGVAAAIVAHALGRPFAITLRGNELRAARSPRHRAALVWAMRRAARVITVSEPLREFALNLGVAPDRARTIPNGIDPERFRPRDRTACRVHHGLPSDRLLVLSAGYIIERKGHHRVLQALKPVLDQGLAVDLCIAGAPGREGRFAEELRALVGKLGLASNVRFLGQLSPDHLAEVMAAVDVLCLASSREGWPNVVHEALGCGTPVVATDVGGVPDMLESNVHGFVVPEGDPVALADALARALARAQSDGWERAAIATHARRRSWNHVATEVVSEFRAALTTDRPSESGRSVAEGRDR